MSYPRTEIRKVENGYIIQQGRNEYVFDNFIEAVVTLAQQYDEVDIAKSIIQFCKDNAGKKWEDTAKEVFDEMITNGEIKI